MLDVVEALLEELVVELVEELVDELEEELVDVNVSVLEELVEGGGLEELGGGELEVLGGGTTTVANCDAVSDFVRPVTVNSPTYVPEDAYACPACIPEPTAPSPQSHSYCRAPTEPDASVVTPAPLTDNENEAMTTSGSVTGSTGRGDRCAYRTSALEPAPSCQ